MTATLQGQDMLHMEGCDAPSPVSAPATTGLTHQRMAGCPAECLWPHPLGRWTVCAGVHLGSRHGLMIARHSRGTAWRVGLMITLRIRLGVAHGQGQAFEQLYHEEYVPAIRRQRGFRRCELWRQHGDPTRYEIAIYFDSEDLRLQWVASAEHA